MRLGSLLSLRQKKTHWSNNERSVRREDRRGGDDKGLREMHQPGELTDCECLESGKNLTFLESRGSIM